MLAEPKFFNSIIATFTMSSKLKNWMRYFTGKNLWVTNTTTAVTLYTLGDIGAQLIEKHFGAKKGTSSRRAIWKELDIERSLKTGSMGLLIGPWTTGFYIILDRRFPGKFLK